MLLRYRGIIFSPPNSEAAGWSVQMRNFGLPLAYERTERYGLDTPVN
jgi:hypothetical protein